MLLFAFLATLVAAQQKTQAENSECLHDALGGALQKGFEECDIDEQVKMMQGQLGSCGVGDGFTVLIQFRDMYHPYVGKDKTSSFQDSVAEAKKVFDQEDYDFFYQFKAPTSVVPSSANKFFEVFDDKDFEAAIDFARAYNFPLILNMEVMHDFRDANIHQVVGDVADIGDDKDQGEPKGRTYKFTKINGETKMKLTYVDVGKVTGGNSMACNWEIMIDGKACTSGPISGSLHTNAGDDDAVPFYISGFCEDIDAGEHTMSIMLTRSSTAANCYTGWQMGAKSNEFKNQHFLLEAEELMPGNNLQTLEGYFSNSMDAGWVTDSRIMTFDKMLDDSYVRISWVDNFRRANAGWCRFELRVDNGHCPGHGIAAHFHGQNPDNQHMPKQLVGYCKKPKGEHQIRIYVQRSGNADCHLGWGIKPGGGKNGVDNYYMEVRELGIVGERLTWYQSYNKADGRDSGYANYRLVDFHKLEDDTEMRFLWNDDARVYGSARRCKWEFRVDGQPCSTGKIAFSMSTTGNDNDHQRNTLLGYCGDIKRGKHRLQVYVTGNDGHNNHDCYVGGYWSTPNGFIIEAEEAAPTHSE